MRSGERDPEFREAARQVLDRLREDPTVASPVVRRLREVLLERLPSGHVPLVGAYDRDPCAPDAAGALEDALVELAEADPEFARTVRGSLDSAADRQWAERGSGPLVPVLWILIPLFILWVIVNAIAAFSGPPAEIP
jgi:hypothetical protein